MISDCLPCLDKLTYRCSIPKSSLETRLKQLSYSMAPPVNLSRLGLSFTSKTHHDTYAEINSASDPAPCAGKTVLVTGAAQGMGRAIVISYARAGASRIAITDRKDASATSTQALQAAVKAGRQGLEVLVLKLDVCDYASIEACVAEVSSKWGHVDILVNNAGYLAPFEPLGVGDKDEWWRTWEINVRGVYWVVRALLPLLLQSTQKTIVNLASIGALALSPGASAYQPSKMAVMRLTEYLMLDYMQQVGSAAGLQFACSFSWC
jgi:NADP-dependent 3-hydroxy acid dehydrogenase YdfG